LLKKLLYSAETSSKLEKKTQRNKKKYCGKVKLKAYKRKRRGCPV
jgi:hypothetical protein